MARKSGVEYADDVRELRAQGVDFPSAVSGYILSDAANWSSGQKAAVTRAINEFDFEDDIAPERGLDVAEIEEFFDDAIGEPDLDEEFSDVDFFDFGETEDLADEESDEYDEE